MLEIKSGELYRCPYCKSGNINGKDVDYESWSREVKCMDCHRTWDENLNVYEIVIPDEYEDAYKIAHPVVLIEILSSRVFNPQPKPEKGKKK